MMPEPEHEQSKHKSIYKEWIEPFLIAAIVALFIRQFVVEAFKIPSGSMIPTLDIGDHLLVNKFIYGPRIPFTDLRIFTWKAPKRGDIIVFKYPEDEAKNSLNGSRPGDKIETGGLFINDRGADHAEGKRGQRRARLPIRKQLNTGSVNHQIQYLRAKVIPRVMIQ
jgi:signal peptidase I